MRLGLLGIAAGLLSAIASLLAAGCGTPAVQPGRSEPPADRAVLDSADRAESDPGDPAGRFVGSWRLDSWTTAEGADRCGEDGPPAGQIIYSADGQMSAQLGCPGVEPTVGSDPLTAEQERRRLTRQHFSYYGRYTVDPEAGTVTHHVLGSISAGWVGEDRVRAYTFEGDDRLVLDAGGAKLVWVRNGVR